AFTRRACQLCVISASSAPAVKENGTLVTPLRRRGRRDYAEKFLTVRSFFQSCDFCAFLWRVLVFVRGDAFGEGVAVDAENGGRVRQMLFVAREGLLYIELLKLAERFIQKDVALEHLVDQAFESGVNQSSFPVNNRYASR